MKEMCSLNEVGLLPSAFPTEITSRENSCICPYYQSKDTGKLKLPIFVSPMPSIINLDNYEIFNDSLVTPILPRTNSKDLYKYNSFIMSGRWKALSLNDFINMFVEDVSDDFKKTVKGLNNSLHICIDMANGHMQKLVYAIEKAKNIFGNSLVIMAGNIGHPNMYAELSRAGADYIRVGIGGGNACTTSVLTGIHASLVWLIEECKKIKSSNDEKALIVADGGIDTIDKAIKCLALGADFVMMGKQFAKCEEACGEIRYTQYENYSISSFIDVDLLVTKERKYYGNASKEGQFQLCGTSNKPSEGINTWVKVDTDLKSYCNKFEASLRSAMAYTGHHNISTFIGGVEWKPMSIEEFKSYYKDYES